MTKCIERHGHTIDDDGKIHYDDRPTTIERLEEIVGHRLDRRRNYAIVDGEVCELASWSEACSGCAEAQEFTSGPSKGNGCHECGYTGRSRRMMWLPVGVPAGFDKLRG